MKIREKLMLAGVVIIIAIGFYGISTTIKEGKIDPSIRELCAADYPYLVPVDKEYITIGTTSMGLTVSKYYTAATNNIRADYAFIIVNQNSGGIIVSPNGSNVVATDGPIAAGQNFVLGNFKALQGFLAKRAASTNAGLHVWYYKLVR